MTERIRSEGKSDEERVDKSRRGFMKSAAALAGAASLSALPDFEAVAANLESAESKIPSAEEIETQVRSMVAELARKDAPLSEAREIEDLLRQKVFGGQKARAGIDAFRASGLRFEGDIVPLFQAANNGYARFLGATRGFPGLVLALMRTEQVREKAFGTSGEKLGQGVQNRAQEIHDSAVVLAIANDQLIKKIRSLGTK